MRSMRSMPTLMGNLLRLARRIEHRRGNLRFPRVNFQGVVPRQNSHGFGASVWSLYRDENTALTKKKSKKTSQTSQFSG